MSKLASRDIIIAIDKSGSMSTPYKGTTRFGYAQEQTEAIARKAAEYDADGIDVIVFNNSHKQYSNVTPDKVAQVFKENEPSGGTNTADMLKAVFDGYFTRKTAGEAKPITLVVVTDGAPNPGTEAAVKQTIIDATKKMDADEEIGVQFIQVGDDAGARAFLKSLDDDLQGLGAKFDIVDTKNEEEMDGMTITEVLEAAEND
jgi:Mg-chelatase subunit ChlD